MDVARADMSSGRFLGALAALGEHRSRRVTSAHLAEEITLAEALLLTGNSKRAVKIAKKLHQSSQRTPDIEARGLSVMALAAFERGRVGESLRTFQRAHRIAQESGDLDLVCRIRLDSMANLSDISGPSAVTSILAECERDIASLGSPHLRARFHITVGQIEGKRGLLKQAELHLQTAKTFLSSSPNAWLSGLLHLNSSTVSSLRMEFEEGLFNAEKALECAEISGHLRTKLGAIGNIAYLSLWKNDLTTARERCSQGLRMSENISDVRIALLETMGQVTLAERTPSDCRTHLAEIERITSTDRRFQESWYAIAAVLTKARLHQQESNWEACLSVCEHGMRLAAERRDPPNQISLRVLAADALIELGRSDEATTYINSAAELAEDVPVAIFAEIERVRATLLARSGEIETARRPFERSLRVLSAVGGVAPRMDATLSYLRTMQPDKKTRRALETEPWNLGPLVEPTLPGRNTRQEGSPINCPRETRSIEMTDAVALERLAWRPDLLAQEAFVLLRESGQTTATAIIDRSSSGNIRVLAHEGWSSGEARHAASSGAGMRLPVGLIHERELELVVQPKTTVRAHGFLRDLQSYLRQSVAFKTVQEAERARHSLMSGDAAPGDEDGVFVSDRMREIVTNAKRMAKTPWTVLILGETGTGKEVIARLIHKYSDRSNRDFVAYNCTGVPKDMVESQLFGHRRGAFTGAQADSLGIIRAADGGTLLLDEIGELDPDTQPKLLRFLEHGEIQPIGESRPVKVDVRVIAATNANLDDRIRQGRFREDLLYRINVFTLHLPPLRSRREEILPLAQYFLHRYARESGRADIRITEDAQKCLLLSEWPGNVRQVDHEIKRAFAMTDGDSVLGLEQLSSPLIEASQAIAETVQSARTPGGQAVSIQTDRSLADAIRELETAMIRQCLKACNGHHGMTAQRLGLSRKGLYLKRKRLGITGDP